MTAFTLAQNENIDNLASKAGGDTYDTNGFILTIDQDSRVGLNQTTSTSLGSMTINATKGGKINIDATAVKLIAYTGGSGNVPAWNTVITESGQSGSGKLIGVYSSLTAASTATGAAMPASGYIKIKQVTGTYAAGALTGISATASGAATTGWLEIVGDEAATINANRLGEVNITGAWFPLGTTSGTSNQTMQIPNNGLLRYAAGVFIEKTAGQADYEFYPNAGTTTTTGTEAERGKVVWIDNTGLVRIGNSGAATNGYTPASGLAVVVPNIFLENCTTAARTANVIPNATIATRFDFTTTGGGVVNIDKANLAWYGSFSQPYSVQLTNCCFVDAILLSECATPITWSKVGVGNKPTTALSVNALTLSLCFAGGTLTDCVWSRVSVTATNQAVNSFTDIEGFALVRDTMRLNTNTAQSGVQTASCTRAVNCTWTDPVCIGGKMLFTTCNGVTVTNAAYMNGVSGTTGTSNGVAAFECITNTLNALFSGLSLPVTNCQPYVAILLISAAGCANIKLRNIGTRAAPLSLGSVNQTGLIYQLATGAAATDVKIQRVYVSSTRTNTMTADNSSTRITEENVFGDYADAPLAVPLNFYRKGCGCTPALTAQTSVYGTHWFDSFTSTTAGRLGVVMNEPSSLTTAQVSLSGGAAFTSAGGLYMPTIGQIAIFETPNYVLGHTAFANSAGTMGGGTIGNYTIEYQIDKNDGAGYNGTWTAATGANLSGITGIDASKGFKFKVRITTGTTNTTAITSLYFTTVSTTTAQDYQYPLDPVPAKVTAKNAATFGTIQNARVYLVADTGGPATPGTVILNTLTDASGIAQDTAYAYVGDQPVTGRVRKSTSSPLYRTSPVTGIITSTGLDVTTFMVADE